MSVSVCSCVALAAGCEAHGELFRLAWRGAGLRAGCWLLLLGKGMGALKIARLRLPQSRCDPAEWVGGADRGGQAGCDAQ